MKIKNLTYSGAMMLLLAVSACRDNTVLAPGVPTLAKPEVSDIENFQAKVSGSISKMGSADITQHGFILATSKDDKKIDDKAIKKGTISRTTPPPIPFTETLGSLAPGTEYFVWAYASTAEGDAFSEAVSFKTEEAFSPGLTTNSADNITHNAARLKGTLTSKGTYPITEYGLVWATSANPATSVTTKYSVKNNVTNFPTAFNTTVSNLSPNTTYNFRAYVISNGVTTYGANTTFKTTAINPPAIATGNADNITVSSARLGGTLTTAGTVAITERGVVWSTSANPTTTHGKASISGNVTTFPNNYTVNATGLTLNTTYNYRAYVISNGVTTYGENKTFKTSEQFAPAIRTDDGPKVGENVATAWGTLTAKGSHPISEYGLCWNTSANPTTSHTKKSYSGDVTTFPKQFDAFMENLNPGTTYHYRAYVIMNGTTTYGENKSFTTGVAEPRVTTGDIFSISGRGTVMTGTVNSQGSFPITEIGIVYGPTNNPTTSNTKLSKSGSGVTFPHNYDFVVQGFGGTGAVYFRAYVISNGKTYYGTSKIARAQAPGLSTGTHSLSGSTYTLRGSITSAGTHAIREYGIVWSSTSNTPTTSHNKLSVTTTPSVPLNFTRTITISAIGSCRSVTYRAYAITTDGTTHYASTTGSFGTGGCVN